MITWVTTRKIDYQTIILPYFLLSVFLKDKLKFQFKSQIICLFVSRVRSWMWALKPTLPLPDEGIHICRNSCGHGPPFMLMGSILGGGTKKKLLEFENRNKHPIGLWFQATKQPPNSSCVSTLFTNHISGLINVLRWIWSMGKNPYTFKASFLKIPLNYQTFTISKVENHLKVV